MVTINEKPISIEIVLFLNNKKSSSSEEAVKPATDQNIPKTCLTQEVTSEKIMKICSPEYVLTTDAELQYYFRLHHNGRAAEHMSVLCLKS